MPIRVNPIPTGHGRNQPIYERHVTKSGRNRVKGVTHAHLGPIWNHSKPSDGPYNSPNEFLGLDFFCRFLQQTGSSRDSSPLDLYTMNLAGSGDKALFPNFGF